jgi:hypothetical protein
MDVTYTRGWFFLRKGVYFFCFKNLKTGFLATVPPSDSEGWDGKAIPPS